MSEPTKKNQNLARYGAPQTLGRLFTLMKDGKRRTVAQAARELRVSESPVYAAAKKLRDARDLRICGWEMSAINGRFISVWEFGSAPDEPKPKREAWKQPPCSDDEHAKRIAEELARPAFRHWQDAALFGEARA